MNVEQRDEAIRVICTSTTAEAAAAGMAHLHPLDVNEVMNTLEDGLHAIRREHLMNWTVDDILGN